MLRDASPSPSVFSTEDLRFDSDLIDSLLLVDPIPTDGVDAVPMENGVFAYATSSTSVSSDSERETTKKRQHLMTGLTEQHGAAKARKPTHVLRKEEKASLLNTVETLESQLEFLKDRAGLVNKGLTEKMIANDVMREAAHFQHLSVARTQSAISEYLDAQTTNPLSTCIRLGTNWDDRSETLRAVKETKLRRAYEYVAARSEMLDPFRTHCSANVCENENGDKCGSRFDSTPLEGVEGVKQVFDTLLYFLMNIEISISERLGHITVREDYDSIDNSISNYRLLSDTNGIPIESNGIVFSKYYPQYQLSNGAPCGIIVVDFVDDDALYPYAPSERVRKDVSAAFVLTQHVKTTQDSKGPKDTLVVTLSRAGFFKLHLPQFDISPYDLQDVSENGGGWGQIMIKAVKEMLQSHRA
uniref:Uncharacterized protein n=1 Tax=Globisporangium ultimum (strain ATCC 200006 / CBS 805.95 / DAOM BR144) TaxID=431595 RepID=K3X4A4_GLOUD